MEFITSDEAVERKQQLKGAATEPLSRAILAGIFDWQEDPDATGPVTIPLEGNLNGLYADHRTEIDDALTGSNWDVTYDPQDYGHDVQPGDPRPVPKLFLRAPGQ